MRVVGVATVRSPRLGYALAAAAAALFAANGSLARFLLEDGVSAWHLTELRSVSAFALLAAYLALADRAKLRVPRADVRRLAFLGIAGLALVQATYYAAIERVDIGVVLTIQYLAPMAILVWLRLVHGRRLALGLWGAVALSAAGSVFVVRAYDLDGIDGVGLLFAVGAMVTFAINLVASERAGARFAPQTTLLYGFGFASLFWLVAQPPWTFPFATFAAPEQLALGAGIAITGTLVPFLLLVAALRHLSAARTGIVATLEPVLATIIAWPVHGQALAAPQVAGILVVVGAVAWVQAQRPAVEAEAAAV